MKNFLISFLVIFLNFSNLSYAENIKDIEMEGLSIGESLLKYFNKNEIVEKSEFIYANEKSFSKDIAGIFYKKNLSEYDAVQIDFKFNDLNFTIVGLSGFIAYENDLNNCYKKQNQIFNELQLLFPDAETKKGGNEDHPGYPKGEVKLKRFSFFLNENEYSNLEIICFDAVNHVDRLSVSMKTAEFNEWMYKLNN